VRIDAYAIFLQAVRARPVAFIDGHVDARLLQTVREA
jgi:prepilin-type processing-associated H-X9-DG protein